MKTSNVFPTFVVVCLAILATSQDTLAETGSSNSSQWGGSSARNNVSNGKEIPSEWNVGRFDRKSGEWDKGEAKNVRWTVRLGSQTYGTPIVAGNRVYCATNNGAGRLKRFPAEVDLGCLLAFDRNDGRFLWQYSSQKLKAGRSLDWPEQGICSSPLVENDRLWIVNNRGEVVCLDTDGFDDGENDGPYKSESVVGPHEADVVWSFDMMKRMGSVQHNMCSCSVTSIGDLLLVNTSNGVDESHNNIPAPEAASFIALDKATGKLIWADNSPGRNILHGQWSSSAAAVLDGVPQAIFAGGDGWIYSFLAEPTTGKPKLLWKFDCNPKASKWKGDGRGGRSNIIATPVIHDCRVYIATGQDPEYGEAQGHLWCIDPTKRGDVSLELVFDRRGTPVPPRRIQAADVERGDVIRANPNSAVAWHYTGKDADNDGERDFEETMHRSLSMVAIKGELLVTADFCGLVHCLDAKTGRVYWTYDTLAAIWGSPLIVDNKIYIGDEDGDVAVFELSKRQNLLSENNMGSAVYGAPVVVGRILFIASRNRLFAISTDEN